MRIRLLDLCRIRARIEQRPCAPSIDSRDRAILGILAYAGARVGAVAKLRLGDLRNLGEQRSLCFREKSGKVREIPMRHDLDAWLREYLDAAGGAGQTTNRRFSARPTASASN